jgi:diguanylate cyclase (GGDEF)-like protein/PAS domain S-box-containing protein
VHDQQGERTPLKQCPIFQAVIQGKPYHGQDLFQRKDKSIFPVDVISQPMWENGEVAGSVTAFRDITERKSVEEDLRESEERFRTTLENLPGAVFTHDLEGSIVLVNRAACQQTGYSREELLQMKVEDIDPQAPTREDILDIWQNMEPGQSSMVETSHIRKDGSWYPAEVLINAITIDRQPVMLAVAFDISERKEAEERLRFLATTDELTYMWNRRRFTQATRNELERAHRYQQIFSLLMLDIDYFKKINDTYGHGAGDEVLRHIAYLIRQGLRQVDMPGRFGGEEFAIILPHTDLDGAYLTAERMRQCIENTPAVYNNIEIPFSVSIGVATYQDGIKNEDEIYKMADDALYEAKRKGRNLTETSPGK